MSLQTMSRAEPDPLQQCDCGGDVAPSYGKSLVFNAGLCDEAVRPADELASHHIGDRYFHGKT